MTITKKYYMRTFKPTQYGGADVFSFVTDQTAMPFSDAEPVQDYEEINKIEEAGRMLRIAKNSFFELFKILPEGTFAEDSILGIVDDTKIQEEVFEKRTSDFKQLVRRTGSFEWLEERLKRLQGRRVRITIEMMEDQEPNRRAKSFLAAKETLTAFNKLVKPVTATIDGVDVKMRFFSTWRVHTAKGWSSSRIDEAFIAEANEMDQYLERKYKALVYANGRIMNLVLTSDGKVVTKDIEGLAESFKLDIDTVKKIHHWAKGVVKAIDEQRLPAYAYYITFTDRWFFEGMSAESRKLQVVEFTDGGKP